MKAEEIYFKIPEAILEYEKVLEDFIKNCSDRVIQRNMEFVLTDLQMLKRNYFSGELGHSDEFINAAKFIDKNV